MFWSLIFRGKFLPYNETHVAYTRYRQKPTRASCFSRFIFAALPERLEVQLKPSKQLYKVTLTFANEVSRTVDVKASSREVAERKALKFNPGATGVKRAG